MQEDFPHQRLTFDPYTPRRLRRRRRHMTGAPPFFKASNGNAPCICTRSLASFNFK